MKKKKSRIRKYIKRLLIVGIIISIPVSIVWYGWVNTFFTVVPPNYCKTYPQGAILWSYWDDRADNIVLSPDFVQVVNTESIVILVYNHLFNDLKPMVFPYNTMIHQFASGGLGTSVSDVLRDVLKDKKQDSDVEPNMEDFDNWQLGEKEMC